ncbi:MAG TPA: pyridoxal-phosphate dependent enzyme [Chitinophagaceae bacterium]
MIAGINALVDLQQAVIQQVDLPLSAGNKITSDVLRIDKIHATVSGNKWFKLKYTLQDALEKKHDMVVTFGGAWSNHLVATAVACSQLGITSIGVIRGEEPEVLSPTLNECLRYGMRLHFMDRHTYREKEIAYAEIRKLYPGAYMIEEGGRGPYGVKGAGEILDLVPVNRYSHICCAVGTGTMMAGVINASLPGQQVIGISALKIPEEDNQIEQFIRNATGNMNNFRIVYDYHFGGYARKTTELTDFMNAFYNSTGIPLDFVYTAKLLFGINDMAIKARFPAGSRLLIIHSGGLQGNQSLPKNTLVY